MALKLYNTLSRKKEDFKPIAKGKVGMYSCGPTVYWYQTIGNLRTYVFSDILKRVLVYDGFKVKHVMNVTDVGHLTSDADEGEDKMERAALKEGKKAEDIANHYWSVFRQDLKKVNITEPSIWCKATEHIKEQITLIEKLIKKGYTYETEDGIYFDTSKCKDYGKLAKLNKEGLEAGKRVALRDKKNATDFALWKFSEEPGVRQQEWKAFGKVGFPGWHIECSAMSSKYLGEHFDIHTGGIDHIPVHHTNEIAQSESANGKKFVNYWLHGNFLTFKGEKVSKSKGGLYTITELEEQNFAPLSYRYFCLTAHYRSPLEFSLENLEAAQNAYKRLKNICESLKDPAKSKISGTSSSNELKANNKPNKKYLEEFEKTIDDDLDMPKALAVLWNLLRDDKAEGKYKTVEKIDKVFGLKLFEKEEFEIPLDVKLFIEQRENARKNKNWKLSDELRDKISEQGYIVSDTSEGPVVKRK
jgi:cysteinyl-tRNA synthetase